MSKIRTWLDGIGLVQYAQAFEANDIDIDLLGQVDDQVLKDIGVASAGHRLRIRNAIREVSSGVERINRYRLGSSQSTDSRRSAGASPRRQACASIRRASACDGYVLRSSGFNRHSVAARR